MATLVARQGRHRQRYQGNYRLVSGCIPYRIKKGCEDHTSCTQDCLEVCMVSSPNRRDLVFPKGGWDNDETVHEAACREALEEVGVRGILNKNELGVWEFRSKSRQFSLEGGCRGYMFAMEVTEELNTWPEQVNHGRQWLSIDDAFSLCRYDWMRDALRKFLRMMETEQKQKKDEQPTCGNGDCCACKPSPTGSARITLLPIPASFCCSANSSAEDKWNQMLGLCSLVADLLTRDNCLLYIRISRRNSLNLGWFCFF